MLKNRIYLTFICVVSVLNFFKVYSQNTSSIAIKRKNIIEGKYNLALKYGKKIFLMDDTLRIYFEGSRCRYFWDSERNYFPGYSYSKGECNLRKNKIILNSDYDIDILSSNLFYEQHDEKIRNKRIKFEDDCTLPFTHLKIYKNGQMIAIGFDMRDSVLYTEKIKDFDSLVLSFTYFFSTYNLEPIDYMIKTKEYGYKVKDTISNVFIIKHCDKFLQYMFFKNYEIKYKIKKENVYLYLKWGKTTNIREKDSLFVEKYRPPYITKEKKFYKRIYYTIDWYLGKTILKPRGVHYFIKN